MKNKGKKIDGRTYDIKFSWFTQSCGEQWEQWRCYAAEWLATQHAAQDLRRKMLTHLFESYLHGRARYAADVTLFFKGSNGHRCSTEELLTVLKATISDPGYLARIVNYATEFVDWVIAQHFSEQNDNGLSLPLVENPFTKVQSKLSRTETVRNPLPYRYIQELRRIVCPRSKGSFTDWVWAQAQTGQGNRGGDWFDIAPSLIDINDLDCVWRTKKIIRNNKKITIHQLWSPVKAMLVFIKLHLPLRMYQVRMLDSGEADTWRYDNGNWRLNTKHGFALGTATRPFAKGVFKRIYDSYIGQFSTGLYISTNKTADHNKEAMNHGYTIPWQNEDVLYWLEKLRNWQEKYNPILQPIACTTLLTRHTGQLKSTKALSDMGEVCFLFRDARAKGDNRFKPINSNTGDCFWYQLLHTLECQLFERVETLSNGERLRLVQEYPEGKRHIKKSVTHFPLHSLRVSLITCYTMDTNLPLPVISKLLAGHTRLLMTIYYNKITPSMMAEKMDVAHQQIETKGEQSIKCFIKDADINQIQCKTVYHDRNSIEAALVNRNPIGWEERHIGLCLVGGNTVRSDEINMLGGCWNGGETIKDSIRAHNRIYGPVPHGPENCVRCRFFITAAQYLPALNAHFNLISYRANQAANLAVELEREKEALEDEAFFAQGQGKPFYKHTELQQLQRRYEKQLVETDEYAKDWIATFKLISRIMQIENQRDNKDTRDKLISVGNAEDLSFSLKFIETKSELFHLSLLCEDAEVYPDLQDEIRKTPAILKRSQALNRVLMQKGLEPIFMQMDEKQQLVACNAVIRQMAKLANPTNKFEGYKHVADYLETEKYLTDSKLLDSCITELSQQPFSLLSPAKQKQLAEEK